MFDLAWSEIALIGVVALIAIGPKDLPIAIKAVAEVLKKGRRMASEFQGHVDEMVREANLHEVRDQINELRTLDVKGRILNAVDGDGTLRRTIDDDALKPDYFASRQGDAPALAPDMAVLPEAGPASAPPPPVAEASPPAPEVTPAPPPDAAAEPLPVRR